MASGQLITSDHCEICRALVESLYDQLVNAPREIVIRDVDTSSLQLAITVRGHTTHVTLDDVGALTMHHATACPTHVLDWLVGLSHLVRYVGVTAVRIHVVQNRTT